jgi:hypothetical protein
MNGSGDCHKHMYIWQGLWTDLVNATRTGTLRKDYGWIW